MVKKSSFKYSIGYDDDDDDDDDDDIIRPLCIKLNKMIGYYVKCFHSNKTMSFNVNDNNLLKSILNYGKKLGI